jgi:hypothetical protein
VPLDRANRCDAGTGCRLPSGRAGCFSARAAVHDCVQPSAVRRSLQFPSCPSLSSWMAHRHAGRGWVWPVEVGQARCFWWGSDGSGRQTSDVTPAGPCDLGAKRQWALMCPSRNPGGTHLYVRAPFHRVGSAVWKEAEDYSDRRRYRTW